MLIHQECQLQLCTNAVCTADQYGFCDACHIQFKQTAEAADITHYPCGHGFCDMLLPLALSLYFL